MKYIVIDLEMCQIPNAYRTKEYRRHQEIIQIGAVKLDEDYNIIDQFGQYIAPKYGEINSFISRLTGITKDDLRDASQLEDVLYEFSSWLGEDEVCLVSWSNSDKSQLCYELEKKSITIPRIAALLDTWQDCQKTFSEKMGCSKPYNLKDALIAADIIPEGDFHDGLSDAYNTALLFAKLSSDPDFELNSYYKQAREEREPLLFTIGELFSNNMNYGA